jgi:hypothetical protein
MACYGNSFTFFTFNDDDERNISWGFEDRVLRRICVSKMEEVTAGRENA